MFLTSQNAVFLQLELKDIEAQSLADNIESDFNYANVFECKYGEIHDFYSIFSFIAVQTGLQKFGIRERYYYIRSYLFSQGV